MVNKITTPLSENGTYNKINEIIDALGGGSSGLSYTATCPALTLTDNVVSWSITHNLGTQNVIAVLYNSSGAEIEKNVTVVSANGITVTFISASNVSAGDYKIVVMAGGASSNVNTWVISNNTLYDNVNLPVGDYSANLASYLPNDGAQYEVGVLMSANGYCNFALGSDLSIWQSGIWQQSGSNRSHAIVIVGSGRTLNIYVGETTNSTRTWVQIYGYRKVG